MSIVLDLSQYDLSTLDAECMAANGVTGAILGVFTPSGPEPMAAAAGRLIDAGIALHGFYGLIYFGSPFGETRDTKWAIDLAKRFNVSRVWLDCEIDGKAIGFTDAVEPTRESRVAAIRECVGLVEAAGLSAGIYSGAWWWPGATGNSTEFAHLPLWHAAYFNDGSKVRDVNYGGWTQCAIHQWTSTLNVCGRNRDANHVWDESVLTGGDAMTPEEVERIVRKVFDEASPAYYRTLTRQYWDREAPGAFSAPPDPEVVAGILGAHLNNHDQGGGETEHSHSQYVLKDDLREAVE